MRTKNPGLSLFIAVSVSFLISGIAVFIISSISTSLGNTLGIERRNQIFYMTESGLEAGLFHHNARGQGVDFGAVTSAGSEQTLELFDGNATVRWTVEGRDASYTGDLREFETVQVPLYWDAAADPTVTPDPLSGEIANFTLEIGPTPEVGTPVASAIDYGFANPAGDDGDILIDWTLIASSSGARHVFSPTHDGANDICDTISTSAFICEGEIDSTTEVIASASGTMWGNDIDEDGNRTGKTISSFKTDHAVTESLLTFRSLLPYRDTNGTPADLTDDPKIYSVPYTLTAVGLAGEIPTPEYTITTRVESSDISGNTIYETQSVAIMEKASVSGFDYVVID